MFISDLKCLSTSRDIGPFQHSLETRYVASRYKQAPEHVFQPLAFGNKKNLFYLSPVHVTSIQKVKSCNITVDPAQAVEDCAVGNNLHSILVHV